MEKARTIALNIVVAACVVILLIWGNTLYRQWSQYNKGNEALAAGNYIAAIAGYEATIHMYSPLSPLVGKSAAKLWGIAELLEQRGDRERALVAYRALRSSFYAIHWLVKPGQKWIANCDDKIAALVKLQK